MKKALLPLHKVPSCLGYMGDGSTLLQDLNEKKIGKCYAYDLLTKICPKSIKSDILRPKLKAFDIFRHFCLYIIRDLFDRSNDLLNLLLISHLRL